MTAGDLNLLGQYARENSQDAFSEIVRRHLDLVYSAALRQVRSPELAEEVAQSVFTDLAREAGKLKAGAILTPWLYAVTRRTAIDVIRKESRRQLREKIAVELNAMNATDAGWMHIEPLLEEAVSALDETDRAAVLLRYFENLSLREVGRQLGMSDDAAQKRVARAVERLREFFAKHGVNVGAGGLVAVITANAVQAAPVGLAVSISANALAGTAVSASAAVAATKTIAMTTLQKTLFTASVAVLAGAGIFEARQVSQLRDQIQTLQQAQTPLAASLATLQAENERLLRLVDQESEQNTLSQTQLNELLKLRGQAGLARTAALELTVAASSGNTASASDGANAASSLAINPLFAAWKGQEGKTIKFNRAETISGGAPMPGGNARAPNTSTVSYALSEISTDQAVVKVTRDPNTPAESLVIPARLALDDPAFPKPAGKEDLKIGDQTYACAKYTYSTRSKVEMGRDGQGLAGSVTVWVANGVPGGVVQRKIELTIRASYSISETITP